MQVSEHVPVNKIYRLQQLLRVHGGWFQFQYDAGELDTQNSLYMSYKFDNMDSFKAFYVDWTRETTVIVEKTRKKSWLRTLKNFWSRHF